MSERSNFELEPLPPEVDCYVLLDFDRCIGNTERLQAILEDVVAHHSFITPDDMRKARQIDEAAAGSFDTASWVQQRLAEVGQHERWQEIAGDFVARSLDESRDSDNDVLMPGAYRLIEELEQRNILYGFLTFGSHDWQVTKLQAAGQANAPQLIVDKKEKGKLISSWQQDGKFLLPAELSPNGQPILVGHLVFLDDKPDSFIGAPVADDQSLTLIHVKDPSGRVVRSQQGVVPDGVLSVKGLGEAQASLISRL